MAVPYSTKSKATKSFINHVVGYRHFPPGPQSLFKPQSITALGPLSNYAACCVCVCEELATLIVSLMP